MVAANLQRGSKLLTRDGTVIKVESVTRRTGRFKVFNFEVEQSHPYFVGKFGVLVHNSPCTIDPKKLQHEYKHASDFGVSGNWNKANGQAFEQAIQNHIATAPQQISGTYRGTTPATHHFDPATNLWVAVDAHNKFVAGWKLSSAQAAYLRNTGNIQ